MHSWLVRHGWIEDFNGSGFSRVMSYTAFVMMPGCLVFAIVHWMLDRN